MSSSWVCFSFESVPCLYKRQEIPRMTLSRVTTTQLCAVGLLGCLVGAFTQQSPEVGQRGRCFCTCLAACDCSGELEDSFAVSHVCCGTAYLCVRADRKDGHKGADSTKVNQGLGSKLAVQCVRQFVVHPCISGAVFVSPSQRSKITQFRRLFLASSCGVRPTSI